MMCDHEPKHAKGMCRSCYNKEYHKKNKTQRSEYNKEYHQQNKVKILSRHIEYRKQNSEKLARQQVESRKKNRAERLIKQRIYHNKNKVQSHAYYERNKIRILKRQIEYNIQKYRNNPQHAMAVRVRVRIYRMVKNKSASTKELVGCDWSFLVTYLESKFKPGMTWKNRNLWHIDHIKPLSKFDLTDPEQQRLACHYTNLQPLWAEENLRKGNRTV